VCSHTEWTHRNVRISSFPPSRTATKIRGIHDFQISPLQSRSRQRRLLHLTPPSAQFVPPSPPPPHIHPPPPPPLSPFISLHVVWNFLYFFLYCRLALNNARKTTTEKLTESDRKAQITSLLWAHRWQGTHTGTHTHTHTQAHTHTHTHTHLNPLSNNRPSHHIPSHRIIKYNNVSGSLTAQKRMWQNDKYYKRKKNTTNMHVGSFRSMGCQVCSGEHGEGIPPSTSLGCPVLSNNKWVLGVSYILCKRSVCVCVCVCLSAVHCAVYVCWAVVDHTYRTRRMYCLLIKKFRERVSRKASDVTYYSNQNNFIHVASLHTQRVAQSAATKQA